MGAIQHFCIKFPDFCVAATISPLRNCHTRPKCRVDLSLGQVQPEKDTLQRSLVYIIACNFQLCPKLPCLLKTLQFPSFFLFSHRHLWPQSLWIDFLCRTIALLEGLVGLGYWILSLAACFLVGLGVHLSVGKITRACSPHFNNHWLFVLSIFLVMFVFFAY